MFNVPAVIVGTLAVLLLVHATRVWLLSRHDDTELLLWFAFIPARYVPSLYPGLLPRGLGPEIWTFVTYALIHGDWAHVSLNGIWLLAFGSPVARRFGALRFLGFAAVTAAAGAGVHLLTHAQEVFPMVGASATISGCMAAAMRFMYRGRGLAGLGPGVGPGEHAPAASLLGTLSDPRALIFLAVWFGLNLLFGLGSVSLTAADRNIAWEAHIGGFLAGLVLFALFDPVPRHPPAPDHPPPLEREGG
jgi:membrane associated rhomboid family serine protease